MVTHDFGLATNFCDKIMVMYGGKIMEMATTDQFIREATHLYSIGLKRSIIEVGHKGKVIISIPKSAKTLTETPAGCRLPNAAPSKRSGAAMRCLSFAHLA
ncbi:hypothetical protein [Paenibacillus ihuae]|uniref:ABC transporter ATP-binding protein n=1 Tax=Paenibacillus ihuae TaxID=1232431 RepID=UPI0006D59283|nr:hypothetical protein [Paenibacillus ihuae]